MTAVILDTTQILIWIASLAVSCLALGFVLGVAVTTWPRKGKHR